MVKPYVQVYVYSVYHFTSICNIHTCVYLEICTSLCSWNSYNPHIYIVSMHILMYIVTYYVYRYSMCVCVHVYVCKIDLDHSRRSKSLARKLLPFPPRAQRSHEGTGGSQGALRRQEHPYFHIFPYIIH